MNRLIKVFSIAEAILFPTSQAIFEFHLEKMSRLLRRSKYGANFRFLRNRAASVGQNNQQSEGAMSGEYVGCGKHPL